MKICLIGSGRMGAIRAKILYSLPEVEFMGIIGSNKTLAETYRVPLYKSLSTLKDEGFSPDGFVLTTGTSNHIEALTDIAELFPGVFVFTEKPVAGDALSVNKAFDICEKAQVKLCCGFQRRFDPSYKKLQKQVIEGKIGEPVFARVFFGDHPVPPIEFLKKEGCPFMDLAPHDIDFVLTCIKSDVKEIDAYATSSVEELKKEGIEDTIVINFKFENGCLANFFMTRSCAYGYDQRCEVFGIQGSVAVDGRKEDVVVEASEDGIKTAVFDYSFPQRFKEAFENEIIEFIKCISGEADWPVTRESCFEVQALSAAAAEASRSGKRIQYAEFRKQFE